MELNDIRALRTSLEAALVKSINEAVKELHDKAGVPVEEIRVHLAAHSPHVAIALNRVVGVSIRLSI